MNITLPVSMIPLSGAGSKSGGFVVAVLIGLAIFAAAQAKQQPSVPR
ncbi:MAG: hypothetical protein M9884_03095 [Rhodocyclaceae bacterium]|nr:hypothetical protein [Rhodocyclaceae bacterium]